MKRSRSRWESVQIPNVPELITQSFSLVASSTAAAASISPKPKHHRPAGNEVNPRRNNFAMLLLSIMTEQQLVCKRALAGIGSRRWYNQSPTRKANDLDARPASPAKRNRTIVLGLQQKQQHRG